MIAQLFTKMEEKEKAISFFETFSGMFTRFSIKEQTLFAKRLSFLIEAGVPLLESLYLIRNQTKSRSQQKIFDAVIADVAGGQYLSTGLSKFKDHFGVFTINLIRIGELSGSLAENLTYLADELSKKHALQRKVKGALVYPIFITVTTLGVTSMLTVFIFPKIMPVFVSLDIALPLSTRILLLVSVFLKAWGVFVAFGGVLGIMLFLYMRTRITALTRFTDYALLHLPIAGEIARSYNVSNFCRTLCLLLRSGVPITEAFEITASVTKNLAYREAYLEVAAQVLKGEQISKHLRTGTALFPDMLPHMIAVGETSGTLTKSLGYLAELYESEVDEKTKNLSNTIEPLMLVVMGLIVGVIAVSVVTPIYEVTKNLQH
jgi:type II secretory pathway component PulF